LLRAVLIIAIVIVVSFLAMIMVPRYGGLYVLSETDHSSVMMSGVTPKTTRTISILFIGNSLTSTNDLPAMLVNIAAEDPGNPVQLAVKAFTRPGVDLHDMLKETDALAWAQANRPDYIVLQEQSMWFAWPDWIRTAREHALDWHYALSSLPSKQILFESWAYADGNDTYTSPTSCCTGKSFKELTAASQRETAALAQELDMSVVRVARSYYFAVQAGAPDLFQNDLHHPGRAGTYLAALTFYRTFTHRSGAETTYRPWGVSPAEAAVLVQAAGR